MEYRGNYFFVKKIKVESHKITHPLAPYPKIREGGKKKSCFLPNFREDWGGLYLVIKLCKTLDSILFFLSKTLYKKYRVKWNIPIFQSTSIFITIQPTECPIEKNLLPSLYYWVNQLNTSSPVENLNHWVQIKIKIWAK